MDRYVQLANAIVMRAANDYRVALCNKHTYQKTAMSNKHHYKKLIEAERMISDVERFFMGDVIKMYTEADGSYIMKMLKKEVIEYGYDIKMLKKLHNLD